MPGVGLRDEASRRLATWARCAIVALLVAAALLLQDSAFAADPPREPAPASVPVILLLTSYSGAATSSSAQAVAIRRRLGAPGPGPEVWAASLDIGAADTGYDWTELSELFEQRYARGHLALVMTVDTSAFRFMLEHGQRTFPGVPWIFSAARGVPENIQSIYPACTGVEETIPAAETLDLIETLHPEVARVAVLVEEDPTTRFQMDAVRRAAAERPRRFELEWLVDRTWEELEPRLRATGGNEALLYLSYFNRGKLLGRAPDAFGLFNRNYPRPWYTLYESQVGYGAVGGIVVSASAYGDAAAGLAARVLAGEDPSSVPVIRAGINRPVFDVRALRKFGIPASALPTGSVLKHAQPTFFERNRTTILLGTAVVLAQAIVIALLVWSQARRRQAGRELAKSRDRYQTLVDGAGVVHWEADPRSLSFTFVSGHAERILGFPREQWLDQDFWLSRLHPHDRDRAKAFCQRETSAGRDHQLEYRMIRADGAVVWIRDLVSLVGPPGAPTLLRGVLVDVTADRRAEALAQEQEHRLRAMANHLPGVIYRMAMTPDEVCHPLFYSPGFGGIFGRSPTMQPTPLARRLELYHPDDRELMASAIRRSATELTPLDVETRIHGPDGKTRWVHLKSTPHRRDDGATVWDGVMLDITERKKADEQLHRTSRLHRLLLDELDHRVKNSLGGLLALVDLSAGHPSSVADFAATLRARISAMSSVHGLLSDAHWADVSLERVVSAMTPPHPKGRLVVCGPEVHVPARQATAMGMVVQELMTNSLKHGALGVEGGVVEVAWTLEPAGPGERVKLHLTWNERGGPPILETPRPRVGSGLLQGFAQFELAGSARLTYTPEGARHEITVRLDRPTSAPDSAASANGHAAPPSKAPAEADGHLAPGPAH